MQWRTEDTGEEIKRLLGEDTLLHKETWNRMKGWYRAEVNRLTRTAQITLGRIME